MYLKNYYYYFKKAFNDDFCKSIISLGNKKIKEIGTAGKFNNKNKKNFSKKEIQELNKLRNSNISWINDQWIYDVIDPYLNEANKMSGWNFNVDYTEDLQFTSYGKNQHYDWHIDQQLDVFNCPNNPGLNGKIRKISFSINLSDQNMFDGGEFLFEFPDIPLAIRRECMEIKEKGSIIFFPSFVKHKVNPVTKGLRNSLVGWAVGYPFK
jgi:PKHD-type hydroxylase